ncbi:flagellar basal body L-ring protein FlgH [Novosphingobium sp. CF614]|uniref:flagellar basal body L-ring protein FlgH n=1 Tax=Novosphingobium sp. CF614 TaxID=1884364 RepID=UPI000B80A9A0|nr:flagellar basal body L-ring protein FlgH [Novosphingobium sp. CF614]
MHTASNRSPTPLVPSLSKQAGLALAVGAILAASPALARKAPKLSGFEPTLPVAQPVQPPAATGGIFSVSTGYAPLYTGTRAARVGDPVTILLTETTTTSKSVSSKSQKGGGVSITPPTAGPLAINPNALNASSSSTFNGQGNAAQTSSLASTLSVTIAEVRANGTALVKGEKKMLLSQGDEWVRFSGIIRLADIDQENQIPSTRVADARIEYTGKGALQQASKQGWLGRFFNLISPF